MEIINGHTKEAVGRDKREAFVGSSNTYGCLVRLCIALVFSLSIAGCSLPKLKSSLITGMATTAVVGATSVLPGGVIVPALVGGATAATASALSAPDQIKGEPISVIADTVVQEAPDNFFTLIQKLIEMGGWLLLLIFVVPMVIGWVLPGPLERKKKNEKKET